MHACMHWTELFKACTIWIFHNLSIPQKLDVYKLSTFFFPLPQSFQNGQPDHLTTILFDTSKKELHSPTSGFKILQVPTSVDDLVGRQTLSLFMWWSGLWNCIVISLDLASLPSLDWRYIGQCPCSVMTSLGNTCLVWSFWCLEDQEISSPLQR